MTSSLVGSEMCIRDRFKTLEELLFNKLDRIRREEMNDPSEQRNSILTVSYTHLTLPTICSV
eukprot:7324126-Prorocentrum_lima.AAC.1